MTKNTATVLKAAQTTFDGSCHIGPGGNCHSPADAQTHSPNSPAVKILEANPDFAMLEITCSCGKKTNVKCNYNNPTQSKNR